MCLRSWLQGLVKAAVDEAIKDAHDMLLADIIAELQAAEKSLTAQITLLPGLLGSQIENVAMDAGSLAAKVVTAVNGQIAGFPQKIINGVVAALNPFKGPQG